MTKSAEGVAAMLGAMAAGRPFSWLNPKLPGGHVPALTEAMRAEVLVTDGRGLLNLSGYAADKRLAPAEWLLLPDVSGLSEQALKKVSPLHPVTLWRDEMGSARISLNASLASDVACCLFTSGSTGTPKGVRISSGDLHARIRAEIDWFGIKADDRLLSILPFSFDVGLNQLLASLWSGCQIVILDSWLAADVLATVEERRITGIHGVPSIWQGILAAGRGFDTRKRHASLRYLTVSGGSLSRQALLRLRDAAPGVEIFKTYGQTEAFRTTSLRPTELVARLGSVGRAFSGVQVYVVDDEGQQCPPGQVGEIVHTGLGVMTGYLDEKDPERKLRPNPFRSDEGASPYAVFTGDLGYLDNDGYLYLRGRRDDMLKIDGNRVYPDEIVYHLLALPGVRDAAVVAAGDSGTGCRLVAFVVPDDDGRINSRTLSRQVRQQMPSYMVPRELIVLPTLPRTPTGKVDRLTLREEAVRFSSRASPIQSINHKQHE